MKKQVICSECGEPWSEHDRNHQGSCDPSMRVPLLLTWSQEQRALTALRPLRRQVSATVARRFKLAGGA